MADYRSSSYRRLARQRFSSSPTKGQTVSLKSDSVVTSGGQSAIRGSGGSAVQYSGETVSQSTPEVTSASDTNVVQASQKGIDTIQGQTTVQVSSGVASKLAQQSLRPDVTYSVSVEPRKKQSVDTFARDFVGPKKTLSDLSTKEKIKKVYDETILSEPERAIRFSLTKREDLSPRSPTGQLNFYSEDPRVQAEAEKKFAEEQRGFQASADLLLIGGTGTTFEPVGLGKSRVKTGAAKSVTKSVSSEAGVTRSSTVVSGEALIERRLLGIKVLPNKKVSFKGKTTQTVEETGFLGGVSKEPVLKTSGEGKFDVLVGKKKLVLSSESEGFSVGGVGQRKSVVVVSGDKGIRQKAVGSSVESFVSKESGDVVFGGVVKKEGVEVFASKKIFEEQGVPIGRPSVTSSIINKDLNIDVADPKGIGTFSDFSKVRKPLGGIDFTKSGKGTLGEYYPNGDKIFVNQKLIKKEMKIDDPFLGGDIKIFSHELGHAQVDSISFYGNPRGEIAGSFNIVTGNQIKSPFAKGVPKEVKLELFSGGRGELLKNYYKRRGYTSAQVSEEFGADLFASYRENPALFSKIYPKTSEFYGKQFGNLVEFSRKDVVTQPLGTVSLFEGGSVVQGQTPFSASITRRGVVNLLKKEKAGMTRNTFDGTFKSSESFNGDGLLNVQKKKVFTVSDFKYDNLVKDVLEQQPALKFKTPVGNLVKTEDKIIVKSSEGFSSQNLISNVQTNRQRIVFNEVVDVIPKNKIISGVGVRDYSGLRNDLAFTPATRNKLRQDSKINISSLNEQSIVPISGVIPISTPKIVQRQGQGQSPKIISVQQSGFKKPFRPTPSPVTPPISISPPAGGFFFKFNKNKPYTIEIRRFGKFERIASARNLGEAQRIGIKNIKSTLGATYRIRKEGGLISVNAGEGFYKKGFNIIEKRRYRLNTGSETAEINLFRKNKKVKV